MLSNWYAIRSEPNKERRIVNAMAVPPVNIGTVNVYLPMCEGRVYLDIHKRKIDANGRETETLTGEVQQVNSLIVPGYVFAHLEMTPDAASWISGLPGVLRILPSSLRPFPIADSVINEMRRECTKLMRQTEDVPDLDWMLGKSFLVKEGVFAGRIGPCLSFTPDGQPRITIEVFKASYHSLPFPYRTEEDQANLVLTSDEDAYMMEVARLNHRVIGRHKRDRRRAKAA